MRPQTGGVEIEGCGRGKVWQNGGPMKITPSSREEWMAAACAVASALLLFAVFPPLEWTWAAWVALAPLLGMARRVPGRMAARMGWLAGFLFWLLSVRWLTHVTVAGWMFLSAYCALYFLPAIGLANRWRGGAAGFAASLAVIWCGSEFLRGWIGGGFPWNTLGAGLTPWLPAVQLAEFGGVWLVSGVVVFANALGAWALVERRGWGALAIGALGIAAALGWGAWRMDRLAAPDRSIRVALVQTSIPQDEKWVSSKIRMIYDRLAELTLQAQGDPDVELVIWPETALPDDVRNSEASYSLVWSLCTNGTPILTGSLDTAVLDSREPLYFNSAFLFDEEGRLAGEYDKRQLVIFGEFIPFESWIPWRWRAALQMPLSISKGEAGAVFPAGKDRIPLSPLICFEDILPHLARADVRQGARMLVNLTNDAWFDERVAPRQHMRNAVLRAVENRVPLVRAANTGVSCVIEPSGRLAAYLSDGEGRTWGAGVLWADVPAPPDGMSLTFYTRFGDMYGIACAAATGLWLAAAGWKRRKQTNEL
ncbi:MAG: apolipoprotein N-acyltransferase [Opitutae bacterium]|nr:apolipoprotein N-acyltransferase [Opitutae bacterium]